MDIHDRTGRKTTTIDGHTCAWATSRRPDIGRWLDHRGRGRWQRGIGRRGGRRNRCIGRWYRCFGWRYWRRGRWGGGWRHNIANPIPVKMDTGTATTFIIFYLQIMAVTQIEL